MKKPRIRVVLGLAVAVLALCHVAGAAPPRPPVRPHGLAATAKRVHTDALRTEAEFVAFSKEIGGERFTKLLVDVRSERVWYIDTNVYRLHTDFVFEQLYKKPQTPSALREFNRNYGADKPEFLMCYLTHHLGADVWTFAFWEGDEARPRHIEMAFKRLKETFYAGAKVRFRPDSTAQEAIAKKVIGVPVILNDALYKAAEYQAFNVGEAVGTLRVVSPGDEEDSLSFKRDEIVLLAGALPDITPVAGIVSEAFSTPLSHVNLRAKAWGIPNVGLKRARALHGALAGKVVFLKATDKGLELRLATDAEANAARTKREQARKVQMPKANLTERKLKRITELHATDVEAYGAKSANLGEIVSTHLDNLYVPVGFAIPIAHYAEHMKTTGLEARLHALLGDARFKSDAAVRKAELDKIRAAIVAAPLAPALGQAIREAWRAIGGGGVFVRSSTNAEDLPGFNGAGLYDTVPNVVDERGLGEAVKAVWASVWNLRAWEERDFFGIDHTGVYAAVLVQRSVPGDAAGVLVTVHPWDPSDTSTYTINAKSGLGLRVVEGRKVPETLLYDYKNQGLRVISRSDEETVLVVDPKGGVKEIPNPSRGKPVLTDEAAITVGYSAYLVTQVFDKAGPLDIEWVLEGDKVWIVQARPYVVR